jgi:hypothetical protein
MIRGGERSTRISIGPYDVDGARPLVERLLPSGSVLGGYVFDAPASTAPAPCLVRCSRRDSARLRRYGRRQ